MTDAQVLAVCGVVVASLGLLGLWCALRSVERAIRAGYAMGRGEEPVDDESRGEPSEFGLGLADAPVIEDAEEDLDAGGDEA